VHDIEKKFLLKGYDFIYNSKSSSRGVGILVKSKLAYVVHEKIFDYDDNYLLLDITIDNFRFVLGSIYGPNRDDLEFFDNLKLDVRNIGQKSVIISGDWNATFDSNPVPLNIDVINMASIPSKKRSLKIATLARSLNLTDPYRFFNPEKRDFTFIPNILNNRNRSRLDFFLISEDLIPDCKNATIPHALSSKLLDHKQIALCFKSKRACNTQKINDRILNDDYLEKILLIHTFDTYVNHSKITDAFTIQEKTPLTGQIGALMGTLERIQNLKLEGELYGNIAEIAAQVEALNAELSLGIERLPNLDFFEHLELDCELDVFFETLAFILKNAALSFQSSFFKIKNQRKNRIRKDIKLLKENYANNSNEIFEKESELSNLIDIELKEELSLIKNFERLNDEKITPYFLNLAKTPQKNESIDTICDDNGLVFDEPEMRNNHIHSYYRDLYRKPNRVPVPNMVEVGSLSIEEFLGEAANHPEVLKSKLNENEKNFLDRPLSIDELDFSVKKVKKNSAPGGDGISNRFILKNWNLLRVPLFKYATTCFEKGTLTNNFRSANVRLIPKKGDCTKIKNWRPISLLNCFYKIISRALAERLKQVMDKITQVGQKGYSSSKQCQEVLINIIDVHKILRFRTRYCTGRYNLSIHI